MADVAHQHRIEEAGPLLTEAGRLREPGYAYRPLLAYDHARIAAAKIRIKDWDYYLVQDESYALALTLSDLGYIGLVSASVIDLKARTFTTTSEVVVAPLGRMGMPTSSEIGDVTYQSARSKVCFRHTGTGGRRLSFALKRFEGASDLEVELLLDEEPKDSMVIATPFADDERAFYYNRKIIGMRARGGFRVGAAVHEFSASEALGLLDWGRGVWTFDNVWYWSFAMGRQSGHLIGLNLGFGFGDTSAATENMVFVDGHATKLGDVTIDIPENADGTYRYLEPWHITDDAGVLDLTFEPTLDRTDFINVAAIITSDQHQVFGTFTGTVALPGLTLTLENLPGATEHIHNRY